MAQKFDNFKQFTPGMIGSVVKIVMKYVGGDIITVGTLGAYSVSTTDAGEVAYAFQGITEGNGRCTSDVELEVTVCR